MAAEAYLEGSVLYIDGREWGVDYTLEEACDLIASLQGHTNAPTGVRTFNRPRSSRRYKSTGTGWPMTLGELFVAKTSANTGWPEA